MQDTVRSGFVKLIMSFLLCLRYFILKNRQVFVANLAQCTTHMGFYILLTVHHVMILGK